MGRRGSVARGILRVVAADAGNQEVLRLDGDLICDIYQDADFVSNRATISFAGDTEFEGAVTRIDADSEATVGDGSFAFKTGPATIAETIFVWDVEGAVLHDYAVPATTRATTPLLRDGWLWWLEWPIAYGLSVSVLLKKSRCDLATGLATVHTFTLPEKQGNAGGAKVPLIVPLDGDLWFLWQMSNEDGEQWYRAYSKDYTTGVAADVTADVLFTQFSASNSGDDWAQIDPNPGPDQSFIAPGCAVYYPAEGKAYVAWHPCPEWPGPGTDPGPRLWSMDSPTEMIAVWTSSEGSGNLAYPCLTRLGDVAQIQVDDVYRHPVPDPGGFPDVQFGNSGYTFYTG